MSPRDDERGLLLLALDDARGSWDRGSAWSLPGSGDRPAGVLAFVSDGPVAAQQDAGRWLQTFLDGERARLGRLLGQVGPEEVPLLLADLATRAGDHLREQGGGQGYLAAVFALALPGRVHLLPVGDCAAWVRPAGPEGRDEGTGPIRRVSDTTRVEGSSFPTPGTRSRTASYAGAVYLGDEPKRFRPADVYTVPVPRGATVSLVSDGLEDQLGAGALAELVAEHPSPKALEEAVRRRLDGARLMDDVTLVAFAAPAAGPSAADAALAAALTDLQSRLQEDLKSLDTRLGSRLDDLTKSSETEVDELRRELRDDLSKQNKAIQGVAQVALVKALETRVESMDQVLKKLRTLPQELADLRADLSRLEGSAPRAMAGQRARGATTAAAARASMTVEEPIRLKEDDKGWNRAAATDRRDSPHRASGSHGRAASSDDPLELPAWLRKPAVLVPAALVLLALVVGWMFLRSEAGKAFLAARQATEQAAAQLGGGANGDDAGASAGNGASTARPPAVQASPVSLVYLPPGQDGRAVSPRQVSSAEEALAAMAGGEAVEIPAGVALELAGRLGEIRWEPYEVRDGDSWQDLGQRTIAFQTDLSARNGGGILRAGTRIEVPTLHYRIDDAALGGRWQEVGQALGERTENLWPSWTLDDGDVLLPFTQTALPAPAAFQAPAGTGGSAGGDTGTAP